MSNVMSQLIQNFYTSFQNSDSEGMVNCYHENIEFEDPAFGKLKGEEVKNMWRMLVERSKGNIEITFKNIHADNRKGSADWEAKYFFSKTGRKVHNKIHASFEFEDGRIIMHKDNFNFWRWSSMALGPAGIFLGFTPLLQNKIKTESRKLLESYSKKLTR